MLPPDANDATAASNKTSKKAENNILDLVNQLRKVADGATQPGAGAPAEGNAQLGSPATPGTASISENAHDNSGVGAGLAAGAAAVATRINPDWKSLTKTIESAVAKNDKSLANNLQKNFQDALQEVAKLPADLLKVAPTNLARSQATPLPDAFEGKGKNDISAAGVDQSAVGDCFFDSALASFANTSKGRQAIFNMIKPNTDGSYTVTFPGDKSHPVNVTPGDLTKNLNNGNVADSATWARVVETAMLKYDGAAEYGSGGLNITSEKMPFFGKVYSSADALHLLTGESVSVDALGFLNSDNGRTLTLGNVSQANVRRSLEDAMDSGNPVTADAAPGLGPLTNSADGMADDHVYSVLSYNPKTDTVVVRNPWGSNDGTAYATPGTTKNGVTSLEDGQLQMSLDTFTKRFNQVTFAGQNPYLNDLQNVWTDTKSQLANESGIVTNLFSGNFDQAGQDALNSLKGSWTLTKDAVTSTMDAGENAAKWTINEGSNLMNDGLNTVASAGSTAVHYLNPLNW